MRDFALFRNSLRDLARPKRLVAALILIAAPTLIAALWRSLARGPAYNADVVYNTLSGLLVFGFLLVILAVVFGTGVIAQEVERKTITYLLTRPLPRWRILLAKFAAALVAITITSWAAVALLATSIYGFGGAEHRGGLLKTSDILNTRALVKKLHDQSDPLSNYLYTQLDAGASNIVTPPEDDTGKPIAVDLDAAQKPLADNLNAVIESDEPLYEPDRFAGVTLRPETKQLAESHPKGQARSRLNRELLVEAYPGIIAPTPTVGGQVRTDFLVLLIGALAYGSMFLLLATALNRPLMWGLLFAFGWESWVPNFPGNFQKVSLMSYLRVLAPHPQPDTEETGLAGLFTALNPETISPTVAWAVLLGCIAVFVVLALVIFSTKEYVPRDAE